MTDDPETRAAGAAATPDAGGLTPAGLGALRIAATLAHALPGLRVRIRNGSATLLEVASTLDAVGPTITACAFRRAVANAHERSKRGTRLRFRGLPDGVEPAIDIGVRAGDAVLPGGIYRVAVGDHVVQGFATTLAPHRCRQLVAERTGPDRAVRLHHDAATEVTLVHTVDRHGTPDADHLVALLGVLLADEVVQELTATNP